MPARLAAACLAVAGPALVLALAATWVMQVRDDEDRQADENAGLVFNGQVRAGGAVAAMDAVMARDPEVVIIGPSYANTDLRRDLIAKNLGIPVQKVALLSIPNSVGAHWYAVLKYRVFEAGHRPKLVVVVSGLQSMLLTSPLTESSWVNLQVQLDDPSDPDVLAKARPDGQLALGRLREQRGKARDKVTSLVREVPTRMFLPSSVRSGGMGPLEVRARLDSVFADENVSMALHQANSTPIALSAEQRHYDPEMLPTPEASFIGDIGALAAEHGTRVVWVRPPMSPQIPAELDDVVPEGFQERAVAVAAQTGGSFLDMRRLVMTAVMFKNEDHMNREGSRRFSEALGLALKELDALYLEALPGLEPIAPDRVVNTSDSEELPPEEADWSGEGTWIAPGASLTLAFDQPWARERGVFAVKLAAEQDTPDGAPPIATVGETKLPLAAADATEGWRLWRSSRTMEPPDGPFEIRIEVPEGAPWLRVTGIALGRREGRSIVLGTEQGVDGASARLLGPDRVMPDYPLEPGPVPMEFTVRDLPGRVAQFDTPKWEFLSDEYLMGQSAYGSRCSPLRVTEDGRPLPLPNESCTAVERHGHGRTCHTPDAVLFTATDGSDPARNGRDYRMILAPERVCDTAIWLYPKDRFEVAWPADELAHFVRGATHFTLKARYLQKRAANIRVVLTVDGETRIDTEINGKELYDRPWVQRLDPPLPPDVRDVRLTVENLEYTFYLFEELALSEGPLPDPDGRWLARSGTDR